jgi:hypothetical protein
VGMGKSPILSSSILFLWSSTNKKGEFLSYLGFPKSFKNDGFFSIKEESFDLSFFKSLSIP